MIRLGFLALQAPELSPGQRYRFEAFLPQFRAAGIEVDYRWLLDAKDLKYFYGNHGLGTKTRVGLKGLAKRAFSVLEAPRWDVVFVQREAFFLFNEWAEKLASLAAPLIFDFDDAIWIHSVSEVNSRFAFLKNVSKIPRIAKLAHTVIAGNDYLAAWGRQHNGNVHLVPTCVDTDKYVTHPKVSSPITIGWVGSASTLANFRPVLPVLERIKKKYGEAVSIRVMGDGNFSYAPLHLQGEAWSPQAEMELLAQTHISLMPLPNDEWTKGKCGLKALTAMASGAPVVASPIGVSRQIIRHGENGFLASSDDEWMDRLSELIENTSRREQMGAVARQTVVEDYAVSRWGPELVRLIQVAAHARG
jgi:glycosyltransferase involved in cell wall biosynthesis